MTIRPVSMTLDTKRQSFDDLMMRTPRLDECAHFHYETTEIDNFDVSLIHNEDYINHLFNIKNNPNGEGINFSNLNLFLRVSCFNRNWTIRRDLRDFCFLDSQLHKCVFDRLHSKLKILDASWLFNQNCLESMVNEIETYLARISSILGSSLTCGPILHWFEMDNHGNRLINEESDINTPAIAAAYVVKKHDKNNVETEINLEIGELISVIEMPPLNESFYWKGKKGFEVGYFPAECVQLIDDKISQKSNELALRPLKKCVSPTLCQRPSDLNASFSDSEDVAESPTEAAIRKRSKISMLFRNFVAGIRMRRRDQLKRSGILKERVFGCDLCEHLENSGHELPLVLTACCTYIEKHGLNMNGIYRISGVVSTINKLRLIFDEDRIPPDLSVKNPIDADEPLDIHAVASLLKLYFRELPNPLLTYAMFDSFITTMRDETLKEDERCRSIRMLVRRLPPPHWRTLKYLIRHLNLVSQCHSQTGMTFKNIAIVWAPNLLRTKGLDNDKDAFQIVSTQAVLMEFLIVNCEKIFDRDEYELQQSRSSYSSFVHYKDYRKSPPLSSKRLTYIDVGPEIIPGKYHTIISNRPSQTKRSKFNLPNFKFHNLFASRNPTENRFACRPLRPLQKNDLISHSKNDCNLKSTNLKKYSDFHSRIICSTNKPVKRSESFDSYFKKLKAELQDQDENNDQNSRLNQAKNVEYLNPLDQTIIHSNLNATNITDDTIYEIEEKLIVEDLSHESQLKQKIELFDENLNIKLIDADETSEEDQSEGCNSDKSNDDDGNVYSKSTEQSTRPMQSMHYNLTQINSPYSDDSMENFQHLNVQNEYQNNSIPNPFEKQLRKFNEAKMEIHFSKENSRSIKGSPIKYRFFNSATRLDSTKKSCGGSDDSVLSRRKNRRLLGRSMPIIELAANNNFIINDIELEESLKKSFPNNLDDENRVSKPKVTITVLNTVNKRKRMIIDPNELRDFFQANHF
ncbi:GTPase-activating protein CdGAPr [Sarcoptes scabiei]|uniref:GTPase-activating protein CdGAPr n=1 Tax=Sarcoptes scabiei TaxID=52283 RepID=A0A834VE08_SARSC|nr:GTPase-activating protein CdGAPr [Sarcoptes scabiei]